jgi:Holliday junction resolvase RusA-like endonuclease
MKGPLTITLTYPPSNNRLWRYVGARPIKSREYREWIDLNRAGYLAQAAGGACRQVEGPYELTILATAPDKRRRDLANLEKATSDFLQHVGIVSDDCNCCVLHMAWIKAEGAGVTCTIRPLNGGHNA